MSSTQTNKQFSHQQHSSHENWALETANDKVDEGALSEWWFLGSESSVGASDSKCKNDESNIHRHRPQEFDNITVENENSNSHDTTNEEVTVTEPNQDSNKSGVMWIPHDATNERVTKSNRCRRIGITWIKNVPPKVPSMKSDASVNSYPQTFGIGIPNNDSVGTPNTNMHSSESISHILSDYAAMDHQTIRRIGCSQSFDTLSQMHDQHTPKRRNCHDNITDSNSVNSSSIAQYQLALHDTLSISENQSPTNNPPKSFEWDWDPAMIPSNQSITTIFHDWTPQDSAYGAAVQAFGWIPKRIRKLIEIAFVFLMTAVLIYVVVKLGIILLGNEHASSSGGEEAGLWDDDDHYISNTNKMSNDNDNGIEARDDDS